MLTHDIDADGAAVSIPIFLGDFDGQGHKITGLCLTESCSEYGLFSRVESGAFVRNLTVEGEVIPAGTQTDVGGIVGQMVADITLRFSSRSTTHSLPPTASPAASRASRPVPMPPRAAPGRSPAS